MITLNFSEFCDRSNINCKELLKVYDFLNYFLGEGVGAGGLCLAGGAVRDTLQGKEVQNDYDLFFSSKREEDFWTHYASQARGFKQGSTYRFAKTYFIPYMDQTLKVQSIGLDGYKSIQELLDSFDYTICQFALKIEQRGRYLLYTTPEALWDLAKEKLAVHKISYPLASTNRLLKYRDKGFKPCQGTLSKLLLSTTLPENKDKLLTLNYVD